MSIQSLPADRVFKPFSDAPGVSYCVLRKHEGGGLTLLLRFEPGAVYHAHRHPGGEEYYVMEGELEDLGMSWTAGSYIWHPPQSAHRPKSAKGCLVLVFLPQAVELLT